MARHAVAEIHCPWQLVGRPWVLSSSPERKQPIRPMAMPTTSGMANTSPVATLMPMRRLIHSTASSAADQRRRRWSCRRAEAGAPSSGPRGRRDPRTPRGCGFRRIRRPSLPQSPTSARETRSRLRAAGGGVDRGRSPPCRQGSRRSSEDGGPATPDGGMRESSCSARELGAGKPRSLPWRDRGERLPGLDDCVMALRAVQPSWVLVERDANRARDGRRRRTACNHSPITIAFSFRAWFVTPPGERGLSSISRAGESQ